MRRLPLCGEEQAMTEPIMNPRILVIYEIEGVGGYFDTAEDLENTVDGWLFGAMEDREARMREVSCFHLTPVEDHDD